MRRLIIIALCVLGACQDRSESSANTLTMGDLMQNWPEEEKQLSRCLFRLKQNQPSKCMAMTAPQRMHGVWFTGFEESGFIPDVRSVPRIRPRPDRGPIGAEFLTFLEIDTKAAMQSIGQPEMEPCPRAVVIEFVGRRSVKPSTYYTGDNTNVVVVDKLISAKLLGKVRTQGMPGYDKECAEAGQSQQ